MKSNVGNDLLPAALNSCTNLLKYQHIAPAPAAQISDGKITPLRKYSARISNGPYDVDQTQSVARRNARERNRVKQVNNSFTKLRQHIPQSIISDLTKGGGRGPQKKISKVDTLRIAVEYIRRLQDLVDDLNSNSGSENSSLSSNSNAGSPPPLPAQTYAAGKQYYINHTASPLPAFEQTQLQIQQRQQQQEQQQMQMLLTPNSMASTQLEVRCHSPTSSFNSSMSFDSGTFEATPELSTPVNAQLQLKYETYESFNLHEEDCSPDDEEILDYISLWQDQQS